MDYDYRRLPTNRYFGAQDNSERKEQFEALFSKFSEQNWSHMLTVTFKRPVTDQFAIVKFCVEYRKRLFKYLYGVSKRYSQIKILPIIESHNCYHQNKKKYHVHTLLTFPHEMREEVTRYEFLYRDRSQMFEKILIDVLHQLRDTKSNYHRYPIGNECDIRPVTNRMGIVDYCLKEFRFGSPEIAWEATNVSWVD